MINTLIAILAGASIVLNLVQLATIRAIEPSSTRAIKLHDGRMIIVTESIFCPGELFIYHPRGGNNKFVKIDD